MDFLQNIVHRIVDLAGYRAVDRRGRRLVLEGTGIGYDATRRYRAMAQCPQEFAVPLFPLCRCFLNLGERTCDTRKGIVDGVVDDLTAGGFAAFDADQYE